MCRVWAHTLTPLTVNAPGGAGAQRACQPRRRPRPHVVGGLAWGVHAAHPRAAFQPRERHERDS